MANIAAIILFALFLFGGGVLVAVFAQKRGRSGRTWAIVSILLSPPVAFLVLLLLAAKDHRPPLAGLV